MIDGVVIRGTDLLAEGDGIGTLCVGVLHTSEHGADVLGVQATSPTSSGWWTASRAC